MFGLKKKKDPGKYSLLLTGVLFMTMSVYLFSTQFLFEGRGQLEGNSGQTTIESDEILASTSPIKSVTGVYDAPGSSNTTTVADALETGIDEVEKNIPEGIRTEQTLSEVVTFWLNFFLSFYIVVAVVIFIYLGLKLLIYSHSDDKRKEIIKGLVNFTIGTLLILLSYAIIYTINEQLIRPFL